MTYSVLVEPADEHRQAFARWCLEQTPPIMTASASGSEVPADLFTKIPDALLDGAHIDGHIFRPVIEGFEPDGDGYRDNPPDVPLGEPRLPAKRQAQRRRNTRKADSK